jgi:hypothetical protein
MSFLAGYPIPTLGPQQLVDCDPQSQGCGGGNTALRSLPAFLLPWAAAVTHTHTHVARLIFI